MDARESMLDVDLRGVRWDETLGQPMLVLEPRGWYGTVTIALSPADAQLLAAEPPAAAAGRLRTIGLVEDLLRATHGRLHDVILKLDSGMVLVAELRIETGEQCVALSSHLAEAILLATRTGAPIRIRALDLRWIRAVWNGQDPAPLAPPDPPKDPQLAHALHSFIESLPLDDFTGPSPGGALEGPPGAS